MFTTTDIRHLISSLPSQVTSSRAFNVTASDVELSETGLPPFLLSASGSALYPTSVLRRKLTAYIATHGSLLESQLPSVLDISDHGPLLRWTDRHPAFSTPRCRSPDLTPLEQKTIAIWFFNQARTSPMSIIAAVEFFGVDSLVVEAVVQAYADSFPGVQEVAWSWIGRRLWQRSLKDLGGLVQTTVSGGRELELSGLSSWPEEVVRALIKEILGDKADEGQWATRREGGQWLFVPFAGSRSKQDDDLVEAVDQYKHALDKDGCCIIEGKRQLRDRALEMLSGYTFMPDILPLEQDDTVENNHWPPQATVLITVTLLQRTVSTLLDLVPAVSQTLWREVQDKDPAPMKRALELLQTEINTSTDSGSNKDLTRLVLHSSAFLSELRSILPTHLASIHTSASTAFSSTVRTHLQLPTHLYTAPLALYTTDPSLADHQTAFLHDFFRTDIFPPFFRATTALDPAPPKDQAKELARLKTATAEARNLDATLAAIKKFARKLKLGDVRVPLGRLAGGGVGPRDDDGLAAAARDAVLALNLKTLPGHAKRPSDVLQQATWCLQAAVVREPMLFVSGGRDAGRMVKLFQRLAGETADTAASADAGSEEGTMDWRGAGSALEEFRGKVKEGKQTEDEVRAIRELAVRGNEARRAR